MNRRNFLIGTTAVLFCAPAIVSAQNIMPVKSFIIKTSLDEFFSRFPQARHIGIQFMDEERKLYGEFDNLLPELTSINYYADSKYSALYLRKLKSLGKEGADKWIKENNDTYKKILTPELADEYRGIEDFDRFNKVANNLSEVQHYGYPYTNIKGEWIIQDAKV